MWDVYKVWLKHKSIWGYFAIAVGMLALLIHRGTLLDHWYYVGMLVMVPFYEWLIHKYFLHMEMKSSIPWLQDFFDKIHAGHHRDPEDKVLVFAPFIVGVQVPLSWFLLVWMISGSLDHALTVGLITQSYYMFYEWMHLAAHTSSYRPVTELGAALRQAHLWHHYKNENYWWGVTSIFGDKLLGTYPDPRDVPKSHSVKDIHVEERMERSGQAS